MIIISDSSALSALAEIGWLDLLPRLFGKVVIPEAVRRECAHAGAPPPLRTWIARPPEWLIIVPDPCTRLAETASLGPGEAAAITLGWEHRRVCRLILDEKRGRRVAAALSLPMTGTLGLIGDAAKQGWVDFDEVVERLRSTGFHLSDTVIDLVRKQLSHSG